MGKTEATGEQPKKSIRGRREFLRTIGMTAGLVGAAMLGIVPVVKGWVKRQRPPGALAEKDFLASCIKCGQCVQVCPVESIKLTDIDDGFGVGTPYIEPRDQACDFSCDGLQCVLACPTGALTHHINYSHQSNMAVAVIANPAKCLAIKGEGFKGLARGADFGGLLRFDEIDRWNPLPLNEQEFDVEVCDLCVRTCPIEIRIAQCDAGNPPAGDPDQCPPEAAIRLVETGEVDGRKTFAPEILAGCVGCGVCEMICPVEPAVIVMDSSLRGEPIKVHGGGGGHA
ncbi:MAG: 4Fe-4S dicluster domain-containing protein [bacterium]|nr:4Fe-4S dicluster domain-containing protein [bacterium]